MTLSRALPTSGVIERAKENAAVPFISIKAHFSAQNT